jgi:hypothetical protein
MEIQWRDRVPLVAMGRVSRGSKGFRNRIDRVAGAGPEGSPSPVARHLWRRSASLHSATATRNMTLPGVSTSPKSLWRVLGRCHDRTQNPAVTRCLHKCNVRWLRSSDVNRTQSRGETGIRPPGGAATRNGKFGRKVTDLLLNSSESSAAITSSIRRRAPSAGRGIRAGFSARGGDPGF